MRTPRPFSERPTAAMPSNDVMNDSSFIDEGTFTDRDWTWSFNALWNKKTSERCRVNIADTVFVSGGEPGAWMFTAKVRSAAPACHCRLRAMRAPLQAGGVLAAARELDARPPPHQINAAGPLPSGALLPWPLGVFPPCAGWPGQADGEGQAELDHG